MNESTKPRADRLLLNRIMTLWGLMRGRRLVYLAAMAALGMSSAMMYVGPLVIRATIDNILGDTLPAESGVVADVMTFLGGRDVVRQNLWMASIAVFAVSVVGGVFSYLRGRWGALATEEIALRLRQRLYAHLQNLPCRFHDQRETGDLLQRCTSDVETIRTFLAEQVVDIGRAAVLFVVAVPILLYMDLRMAAVTLVSIPIVLVASAYFFKKIQAAFLQRDEAEGRMTTVLQENITGVRVVRAFARQEHEIEKFTRANDEYCDRWYRMYIPMSYYWPLSNILSQGQQGLVLAVGAVLVTLGTQKGISPGDLSAYLMYVGMLLWPLRQLGRILMDLGSALVAIQRVHLILDTPVEEAPAPARQVQPPEGTVRGHLVVRDLKFAHPRDDHPDAPPILRGVSLEVAPGATLAILGPSGSGKSTLINLLLRFYDYHDGSITLDGVEIRDMPRKFLRAQIGAVLQEPFLYSRTLRENIKRSRASAQDDEMVDAASVAGIHEAIQRFPHGYDTLIGERGVTLSGGQRQRVALARALLKNPPILVLDDALSAVDTETEYAILDALRTRHGHRTTIVIAHRLTTLLQADQIVIIDGGRIAQSGTHDELLKQPGLYKRLWDIQSELAAESGTDETNA